MRPKPDANRKRRIKCDKTCDHPRFNVGQASRLPSGLTNVCAIRVRPPIARDDGMKLLDLTFPTAEENLAFDEALLDWCDEGAGPAVLRFWEPQQPFVVVGYSNRVERDVNVAACREGGIPILRRCSGGGAVLQGPGCLNYALVLRIDYNPALQTVTGTNRFVMERNRPALEKLLS